MDTRDLVLLAFGLVIGLVTGFGLPYLIRAWNADKEADRRQQEADDDEW